MSMTVTNPCRARSAARATTMAPCGDELLPHWSHVPLRRERDGVRPSRAVAAQLAPLVSWASDLAVQVAGDTQARQAIEHVRRYATAWLGGKPCGEPPIDDMLGSAATLLQGIGDRARDALHAARSVTAQLTDLVSWAADLAIRLTVHCPEDRDAIEAVRRYVLSWLAGVPCRDVPIQDVLTTVATLLAAIDLDLDRRMAAAPDAATVAA
jgi:hypothetical protein